MRGGLGASVVVFCLYLVKLVCSNCYICVFWRIVSLCVLVVAMMHATRQQRISALNAATRNAVRAVSWRDSLLSDRPDKLNHSRIAVLSLCICGVRTERESLGEVQVMLVSRSGLDLVIPRCKYI